MAILKVPKNYPTIQAAVTAAQPGDLILVEDGIYNEEVVVNNVGQTRNRIQIVAREDNAVLDGEGMRNMGFFLDNVDVVEIKGFIIRNFITTGIRILGGEDHKIVRNNISNIGTPGVDGDGIVLADTETNIIWQNKIHTGQFGAAGIRGGQSLGNRFVENRIYNNPDFGIALVGAGSSILIANYIFNNGGDGIIISAASNLMIGFNRVFNNEDNGININAASNMSLINNVVTGNGLAGINTGGTGDALIAENVINCNGARGLEFRDNNFGVLEENVIKKNQGDGIFVNSSNNSLIRNVLKANRPFDINIQNPDNNLADNQCQSSSPPGLCRK